MLRRRRVKHTTSLEARIAERVDEIRAKADALPLGSRERERLELGQGKPTRPTISPSD
jgi:hypothetical protein